MEIEDNVDFKIPTSTTTDIRYNFISIDNVKMAELYLVGLYI